MTIIQQKARGLLAAVYPIIYCVTGFSIAMVGIMTIIVLMDYAPFDIPWYYYAGGIIIMLATVWWTVYFLYKGMASLKAPAKGKK